jgi:hypothetical protein
VYKPTSNACSPGMIFGSYGYNAATIFVSLKIRRSPCTRYVLRRNSHVGVIVDDLVRRDLGLSVVAGNAKIAGGKHERAVHRTVAVPAAQNVVLVLLEPRLVERLGYVVAGEGVPPRPRQRVGDGGVRGRGCRALASRWLW